MLTFKSFTVSLIAGTALLAGSSSAMAQDMEAALKALDDALPGELLHNPYDIKWDSRGNDLKTKVVDAAELSSGQAIQARLKKKQPKAWDSVLSVDIPEGVEKGEEIQVYYYIRTVKAAAGKDTANVSMYVGRNEEPYDNIFVEDLTPGTEWALQSVKGIANADYPAGSLKVEYQLGKAAQTVEIGAVYVSSLGQSPQS